MAGNVSHEHAVRAAGLPVLTVYARDRTARTILRLQPGFATVVRADRRIDTVAIGDPRMVSATAVRRGDDVFDVVLQPQADTGTTNMVLWVGDVTTVWGLEIGPGPRTADVVFVVTQARANPQTGAAPPAAASPGAAPPASARGPAAASPPTHPPAGPTEPRSEPPAPGMSPPAGGASAGSVAPGPSPAGGGSTIELRQTVGAVTAIFRASRSRAGIVIQYEITNTGDTDLLIKPATILVRADGRPAAYGMARDSVDRGRPDIVPRGATETGIIDVAIAQARQVELVVALTPVPSSAVASSPPAAAPPVASPEPPAPGARAGVSSAARVPIVLQATFSGLDRLAVPPGS